MGLKFANNAKSTLFVGINDSITTIVLQSGHGARFPVLGGGDYFYATLEDTATNSIREIVKVTGRTDDTLTVERAKDDTIALSWLAGDKIEMRVNKAAADEILGGINTVVSSANAAAASANAASISETNAANSEAAAAASVIQVENAKLIWLGTWSGSTTYQVNDAVYENGTSYICILSHTNQVPPNITYWDVLALKGTDGVGVGDVTGPASATDNSLARFDGTTGKLLKNGAVIGVDVQAYDSSILKSADIGVTVQGYDATTLKSSDIGTTVQGYSAAASQAEMEAGTESALRTVSPLRVAQAIAALAGGSFPSGTKMLFQQTSAPTGWTKDTTHNDKALRVVSGAVSSGGSVAFSTVFGKTATDATTLTTAQIPVQTYQIYGAAAAGGSTFQNGVVGVQTGTTLAFTGSGGSSWGNIPQTAAAGSFRDTNTGGSHTHSMDIRVQYVDLIIATKD